MFKRIRRLAVSSLGIAIVACPPTPNDARNAAEWLSSSTAACSHGWRTYGEDVPRPQWIVEDGALKLDVTDDEAEATAVV